MTGHVELGMNGEGILSNLNDFGSLTTAAPNVGNILSLEEIRLVRMKIG